MIPSFLITTIVLLIGLYNLLLVLTYTQAVG